MSKDMGTGNENERDRVWATLVEQVADMQEIRVTKLADRVGVTEDIAREVVVTAEGLGIVAKRSTEEEVWDPQLVESLVDRNDSRVYARELKNLVYGEE